MSLTYTMPASDTDVVAALVEHGRQSIPRVFTADRELHDLQTSATIMAVALRITEHYQRLTYIGDAVGPWLRLHGLDRGVYAQEDELDEVLSARIQRIQQSVTLPAIKGAVEDVLEAAGVAGTVTITEAYCTVSGAYWGEDPDDDGAEAYFSFYDASLYPSPDGVAYLLYDTTPCSRFTVYVPAATPDNVLGPLRDQVRILKAAGVLGSVERAV